MGRKINIVVVPQSQHSTDAIKAKSLDLENLKLFNIYCIVPDGGQPHVTTACLMAKNMGSESTIKVRLVAKGYQEKHNLIIKSITAHNSTLRIAFTISAIK